MTRNRRGGRRARQAAPPPAPAVWPGLEGGRYRPLTAADEQQVHRTILDVLENIGMGDPIPVVKEHALKRGCFMNEHDRLCFPRALVEDVIARTPKDIQFLGRDPKHDLEIGGNRVHTYGGGEAVNMLDVGASKYRPSTLVDLYDAARLVDRMEGKKIAMVNVEPKDKGIAIGKNGDNIKKIRFLAKRYFQLDTVVIN